MLQNSFYLGLAGFFLLILFTKKLMYNSTWRATMTPLASIIGSGFLIAAPLLNDLSGSLAPYLMGGLCIISFGVGEIIRWNIQNIEAPLESNSLLSFLKKCEQASDASLGFAYILSITYYLYLFASFVLASTGYHSEIIEKSLTSLALWSIVLYGHQNGLNSLEKIEGVSVNLKLAIILTFLSALAIFGFTHDASVSVINSASMKSNLGWGHIRIALGLLIMVQGFETSRYLGEKYDAKTRIKSMRNSQIFSSIIYILFIVLFIPVFNLHPVQGAVSETSVIDIGKYVFGMAPLFLLTAAVASQLSAAVADIGGAGGLFYEITKGKLSPGNSYVLVGIASTVLIWSFDIFEIISLASKAFALYYSIQCFSSLHFYFKQNRLRASFSMFMMLICLAVLFLGKSFE